MNMNNPVTAVHSRFSQFLAIHPSIGRLVADLSPVFAYVRSNPEAAESIVPMYKRWIFVSPFRHFALLQARPLWQRMLLVAFGMTLGPLWTLFLHQMANIRDVRWRAHMVSAILKAEAAEHQARSQTITVDVLGSGSGLYVIDAYRRLPSNCRTQFGLIDHLPETYDLARQYAKTTGLDEATFNSTFHQHCADITALEFYADLAGTRDMVLMIGVGDHIDKVIKNRVLRALKSSEHPQDVAATNPDMIRLMSKIKSTLKPGGAFVYSFVQANMEDAYLEKVIRWRHRYRTRTMVEQMFAAAGWDSNQIEYVAGPTGVQHIAIARA